MSSTPLPESLSYTSAEKFSERKADLKRFVEDELHHIYTEITPLLTLRHDLFTVQGTEYVADLPIQAQLYDHPTNNVEFIYHDLGLRRGNALDYHQTTEKYDRGFSEEHAERDAIYRRHILTAAQNLGFISKHPGEASNPIDKNIGILDSELEPISEKVAAIVINGAAGMSNVKRVRDAIRNIEAGLINTDRIILSGGTRPVTEGEKDRMIPPYTAGATEIDTLKQATTDLTGVSFDGPETVIPAGFGEDLTAKVQTTHAVIGDRVVRFDAVEAPFDTRRVMDDGSPAKRINTVEAFLATLPLLEGNEGAVVMESHDTWTPWQNLIAHKVYGLGQGRNVYPAGPFNAERIYTIEESGKTVEDITAPQDVVDEIVKTYKQLVQMYIELS